VDTTIVPFLGPDGKPPSTSPSVPTSRSANASRNGRTSYRRVEGNQRATQPVCLRVSHDLKAPLRAISSLADWLVTDYGDKVARRQGAIHHAAGPHQAHERPGGRHPALLTRHPPARGAVTVDVNQLLKEVRELLSPPPGMELIIAPGLPTLQCERTRLTQVFENLISNAIKYMAGPPAKSTSLR